MPHHIRVFILTTHGRFDFPQNTLVLVTQLIKLHVHSTLLTKQVTAGTHIYVAYLVGSILRRNQNKMVDKDCFLTAPAGILGTTSNFSDSLQIFEVGFRRRLCKFIDVLRSDLNVIFVPLGRRVLPELVLGVEKYTWIVHLFYWLGKRLIQRL